MMQCGSVAGVQVRLATPITSEGYVAGKLWRCATLGGCPWHPAGGCGFLRHGTYERVRPPGTLIPRCGCPDAAGLCCSARRRFGADGVARSSQRFSAAVADAAGI